MKTQTSFSDLEYAVKKKRERRDRFLGDIEAVTPWRDLVGVTEPHYPKDEGWGRPPIGVERMLRTYTAQPCFGFADGAIVDAIYDSQAIHSFVGIDLVREIAPDVTPLLKFRRLLEDKDLTTSIFTAINAHLAEQGLLWRQSAIVDDTLIAAPSSTKNQRGERDPDVRQTKKGKQRYFGIKAHISIDAESGCVPLVVDTADHVKDVTQVQTLLHGAKTDVFGDAVTKASRSRKRTWKCRSSGMCP